MPKNCGCGIGAVRAKRKTSKSGARGRKTCVFGFWDPYTRSGRRAGAFRAYKTERAASEAALKLAAKMGTGTRVEIKCSAKKRPVWDVVAPQGGRKPYLVRS